MSVIKRSLSSRQIGVQGGAYGAVSGSLVGDKALLAVMQYMRVTAGRRTMTAGSAKAAQVLAKKVKAAVPSRLKDARKSIGWRRLKATEAPGGGAKVGAKVGQTRAKLEKLKLKARSKGRKGVGIGPANVHWIFQDAEHNERETGKSGGPIRRTGIMWTRAQGVVGVGILALRSRGELIAAWRAAAWTQLHKEIVKRKAF